MEFNEKINYINKQLKEGKKVEDIRKELGIGEKSLQKEIRENKYKFNQKLKQYMPIGNCNTVCNTSCNTSALESFEVLSDTNVLQVECSESQVDTLNYLTNNIDTLKLIIDKFSNLNIEVNAGIVIKLDNSSNVLTSIRVNSTVLNKFNSFCDDNKVFKKSDLISMALKEYIEKYSK